MPAGPGLRHAIKTDTGNSKSGAPCKTQVALLGSFAMANICSNGWRVTLAIIRGAAIPHTLWPGPKPTTCRIDQSVVVLEMGQCWGSITRARSSLNVRCLRYESGSKRVRTIAKSQRTTPSRTALYQGLELADRGQMVGRNGFEPLTFSV